MRGRTTLAAAAVALTVTAATTGAVLLTHHTTAPPAHAPRHGDPGPAYVRALDQAMGWPAPDQATYQRDLATGRTICRMLATGWNEAGVVANMLTWPDNTYTQDQLATAVRVTHAVLCGQNT